MFNKIMWLTVGVIIIMGSFLIFMMLVFGSWEHRGQFGDMFGAVNTLFSGLAFVGLIITLLQQKEELGLQRKELEATRDELSQQREEMEAQRQEFEEQNETTRYQRFENTFFQMINLHHEIVNGLSYTYKDIDHKLFDPKNNIMYNKHIKDGRRIEGRELFEHAYTKIQCKTDAKLYTNLKEAIKAEGIVAYMQSKLPTYFDHYFRNLYRIIKYVDETPLLKTFEERYKYISLVRGQLSRYEFVWLFYNCWSCYGDEKFKPLVEKYAFFKNLRVEYLVDDRDVVFFEETAFGLKR